MLSLAFFDSESTGCAARRQADAMSYSQELQNCQNRDGGWSYSQGASWTEPTCYALLALAAQGLADSDAARRGARWLERCQRPDGGLAPRESVSEGTWLTAIALLLPRDFPDNVNRNRATGWVLSQSGRESGWVYRLRLRLMGVASDVSSSYDGWPWYPDAAAWTIPTALSILALEKVERENADPALGRRIAAGRGSYHAPLPGWRMESWIDQSPGLRFRFLSGDDRRGFARLAWIPGPGSRGRTGAGRTASGGLPVARSGQLAHLGIAGSRPNSGGASVDHAWTGDGDGPGGSDGSRAARKKSVFGLRMPSLPHNSMPTRRQVIAGAGAALLLDGCSRSAPVGSGLDSPRVRAARRNCTA